MDINRLSLEIIEAGIVNLTFSNPFKKSYPISKVNITAFNDYYQISEYKNTQVFHTNVKEQELNPYFLEYFENFKQLDGKVTIGNYNIRINKRGNILRRFQKQDNSNLIANHNRKKQYLLSNYKEIEVLKDLGIVSVDNEIINKMADKFRQINKYVELVYDLIKNDNLEKIKIVDFGAGKSYLTFVLYDFLVNVVNLDVEMLGVDLKENVIKDSNNLAKKYQYHNLAFIYGDINDIVIEDVDMVISLHACDIATDYALDQALSLKAKYIVAVPCCQNELYQQLKSQQFNKMLDYNIVKERLSALITDTVRANVLEYLGYNTQVIEYIDSDHSLKNLMIRARYTGFKDQSAYDNIINLQKEYNFKQKL